MKSFRAWLPGIGFNLFSAIGLRLADLRHPTGSSSVDCASCSVNLTMPSAAILN